MRDREKVEFLRRLSFLVKAHLPLETCISTLEAQARGRARKRFFSTLRRQVVEGRSLSHSLQSAHKSFRGLPRSILKIGEESGTLPESLDNLTAILERNLAMRGKLIQASLYPMLVGMSTLALTGFLVIYIFPKITPIFTSLKIILPLSTRLLVATSELVRAHYLWIFLAVVVSSVLMVLSVRLSSTIRLKLSQMLLKTPIIGGLIRSFALGRISVLLGTLLESHMKIDEAIVLLSQSLSIPVYKKFFMRVAKEIEEGKHLGELAREEKSLFPPLFCDMIAVGEVSGALPESLKHLAAIYESEFEVSTRNLTQLIEPALMILMSVVVGFVAISIVMPLYNITSGLRH